MSKGAASWPTVASPSERRVSIARLVGSARAANVLLSWSVGIELLVFNRRVLNYQVEYDRSSEAEPRQDPKLLGFAQQVGQVERV